MAVTLLYNGQRASDIVRDSKGRFLPGHDFGFRKGSGLKESNINWKGKDVGNIGLHHWVKRNWPDDIPKSCQRCSIEAYGQKGLHLANITGIYNRDFSNWRFMCPKCHVGFDGIREKVSEQHRRKISLSMSKLWKNEQYRRNLTLGVSEWWKMRGKS
jgi:hypothetical protein